MKYGKKNGVVSTEIEQSNHCLTLRVLNQPGELHSMLREADPESVFYKGTRLHPSLPGTTTVASKGDGAWIMQKCASCLQGRCRIDFQHDRTVFEFKCPAMERLDENCLDEAQLGLPSSRFRIIGETVEDMETLTETIVQALDALPPLGRLLLIVDENLDLPAPSDITISGSASICKARECIPASKEAQLLALVRSANDSPVDTALYQQRAHGFLPKAPREPEYKAVMRAFIQRYGARGLLPNLPELGEDPSSSAETRVRTAAAAELSKVCRLIDKAIVDAPWDELKRWLHRIKGIVTTVRAASAKGHTEEAGQGAVNKPKETKTVNAIVIMVDELRRLHVVPHDMDGRWLQIKALIDLFVQENKLGGAMDPQAVGESD